MKLLGGKRLDQGFLADLPVAPGMQLGLYSDAGAAKEASSTASGGSTTML